MLRKFFPQDKNYVLEEAQLSLEKPLLAYLVDFVKVQYLLQHNPLGVVDETVQRIQHHQSDDTSKLHEFYMVLAGIFRYRYYSDNQLTFIFSGEEPFVRYQYEWESEFKKWTKALCLHKNFLMGVLELTVFFPQEAEARFIGERLAVVAAGFFEVKIHPQKGIQKKSA
ncbi:MAG: hypothetical protein HRU69_06330 [Flammeovirgaceae bacterium]|nr:MAG: hypothetical protein HRU69_06330 [Flammeovirgaceae bacterium]